MEEQQKSLQKSILNWSTELTSSWHSFDGHKTKPQSHAKFIDDKLHSELSVSRSLENTFFICPLLAYFKQLTCIRCVLDNMWTFRRGREEAYGYNWNRVLCWSWSYLDCVWNGWSGDQPKLYARDEGEAEDHIISIDTPFWVSYLYSSSYATQHLHHIVNKHCHIIIFISHRQNIKRHIVTFYHSAADASVSLKSVFWRTKN